MVKRKRLPPAAHRENDPVSSPHRCMYHHVSFDKKTWERIQKSVDSKREFGGNLIFDKTNKLLSIKRHSEVHGEYDNVVIPHAGYEFHTHPAHCNNGICALGIPSVADIIIHLEDVNSKTLSHMIFERAGMWIMIPSLRLRGKSNKKHLEDAFKQVQDMYKLVYSGLNMKRARKGKTEELRDDWLNAARNAGIHMRFIPKRVNNEAPHFSVPVKC
jgi:hypothetical protein